jgi:hypothetical protein
MPALSQGIGRDGETEAEAKQRRERRRRATVLEERREIARLEAQANPVAEQTKEGHGVMGEEEEAGRKRARAQAAHVAEVAEAGDAATNTSTTTDSIPPSTAQTASAAAPSDKHKSQSTVVAGINPGNSRLARPPLRAPSPAADRESSTTSVHSKDQGTDDAGATGASTWVVNGATAESDLAGVAARRQVTIDIDLRFRDLKAAVPLYTTDLSVTNNALIRPIVAFIK